jgi:type I restriction enzyme S subunit
MPRISASDLSRYPVALPNNAVARAFDNHVRPLVERIISGVHETRTIAAIRDALLPKLLSGEIRVPDAEKVVEAAL